MRLLLVLCCIDLSNQEPLWPLYPLFCFAGPVIYNKGPPGDPDVDIDPVDDARIQATGCISLTEACCLSTEAPSLSRYCCS